MSQQAKKQVFSKDEVARHSTKDDCWIIISGKVYDVTNWLDTVRMGWKVHGHWPVAANWYMVILIIWYLCGLPRVL